MEVNSRKRRSKVKGKVEKCINESDENNVKYYIRYTSHFNTHWRFLHTTKNNFGLRRKKKKQKTNQYKIELR